MAQGYDSDIQLSVGLSLEDAKDQAAKLGKEMSNIFTSVDSSKLTTEMKKAQVAMSKTASQIDAISAHIVALEEKAAGSAQYVELAGLLDPLREEFEELKKAKDAALAAGDTAEADRLTEELNANREAAMKVRDAMDELETAGQAVFTADDADKLVEYKNKLGDVNNQARLQIEAFEALREAQTQSNDNLDADTQKQLELERQRQIELQRAADVIRGELDPAMAELMNQYDENNRKIAELRTELAQLEEAGQGLGYKEYDERVAALSRLQEAQSQINNQMREYRDSLTDEAQEQERINEGERVYQDILRQTSTVQDEKVANASARLQELAQQMEDMKAKQEELAELGLGPGTQQFDELTVKMGEAQRETEELTQVIDDYNQKLLSGESETSRMSGALSTLKKGASATAKGVGAIATTAIKLSPVGSAIDKLKSKVNGLASAMNKTSKSSNDFGDKMKQMAKKLLSYGLGIASITTLFNKLRGAVKEGIGNLVQTNGGMNETNQAISSVMSSLNALKNAWGAAFAPVLQVVAPILTKLIDMFTGVVSKISMFIASMTGKSTALVARKQDFNYAGSLDKSGTASGTKQQEKYEKAVEKAQEKYDEKVKKTEAKNAEAAAKAEEKQAKAAEKLAKKQEKANKQLGAYDQLNVIAKEDAEELEDVQATEYEMPELEMPDMEDYMQGMTDFDSMFEEVPVESAISDLWQRIKDAWENSNFTELGREVGEKLKELTNNVTQWLVNEAQPLAEKIGTSLGTFVNGLTEDGDVAYSAGVMLGEGLNTIVYGLNSFMDSVDWKQVGSFVAEGANGIVDAVNWEALGHLWIMKWNAIFESLEGFVNKFDFKKLGASIGDMVVTMINDLDTAAIGSSISGLIAGVFEMISGFLEKINWFELGQTIIQKVIDMVTAIQWERVFDAVFECLGAALGAVTALLAGLMTKVGELLVSAWNAMVEWFLENAVDDSGHFTIEGFLNGIIEALKNIGQWIVDHIFKPFITGFKKAFGIQSPSKEMASMGNMLMDGLKKGVTDKINSIKETFNKIKEAIVTVFNAIKTKVLEIWNSLWSKVKSVTNSAWSGIKTILNSVLSGVEKMVNGLIRGINMMISAVNNLSFDIPDWVPEIGGESVGFNIPELNEISIPRLAQGAVIPPNKQFLAMLGDQRSGTNIEAPLSTIVQALNEALDNRGDIGNKEPIVLQLDGRTVAQVVWDEQEKRYKQRGSFRPLYT